MRYQTRELGHIEVPKKSVLCFSAPMLGFESYRKYAMLPIPGAQPFFCLQSLERPQLAFPMLTADELAVSYPLRTDHLRCVAATSVDDVVCWVVAALAAGSIGNLRLNLHAPVIVNARKQLAAQIIVGDDALIFNTDLLRQDHFADSLSEAKVESRILAGSAQA